MLGSVQFDSLGDFFAMGGYAFNVWSVYLLFAVFFTINLYVPVLRKKQILREQKRRQLIARESRRQRGDSGNKDLDERVIGENS